MRSSSECAHRKLTHKLARASIMHSVIHRVGRAAFSLRILHTHTHTHALNWHPAAVASPRLTRSPPLRMHADRVRLSGFISPVAKEAIV